MTKKVDNHDNDNVEKVDNHNNDNVEVEVINLQTPPFL